MAFPYQIPNPNYNLATRLIWVALTLTEVIIGTKFILSAINLGSLPITTILAKIAHPLVSPFATIAVMWSGVIAMAAYFLLAWALTNLIKILGKSEKGSLTYALGEDHPVTEKITNPYPRFFDDEQDYGKYSLKAQQTRRS
ncbi:MAG: hypothetical protein NVSMB66_4690 [Candidatus Doudnabacteria bacterium]